MLDKRKYHENAPMNASGHGMDRKWVLERDARRAEGAEARGGRARAESVKNKIKVRGGTRLVLRIRAGCCLGSERSWECTLSETRVSTTPRDFKL
jgi:hypothetical protein